MSANNALSKIFSRVNMSELPAMSDHVGELIRLLNDDDSCFEDISRVILKDASLTTKLLQVANSAYYSRGVPITQISRAISTLGLGTMKELAVSLALFEDFLKAGVEKEEISKLLALCFLSASQAKLLCKAKNLNLPEEEVFICTLLHNLGKIIVLVYMPEFYRKIQEIIAQGCSDEFAAKTILNDLSFADVGMEIARFWNFSEKVVLSMGDTPPAPANRFDTQMYLLNLSSFCNRLTWLICQGSTEELAHLLLYYEPIMDLTRKETFTLVNRSLELAEAMQDNIIRFGLNKLKIRMRIAQKERELG